jgi:hypothetical protein
MGDPELLNSLRGQTVLVTMVDDASAIKLAEHYGLSMKSEYQIKCINMIEYCCIYRGVFLYLEHMQYFKKVFG